MVIFRFYHSIVRRFVLPLHSDHLSWLAAFMLALGSTAGLSQSAPSPSEPSVPDLRILRVEYRKSLLSSLLPEKKAYRDDLLTMERNLAARADYAGAIRVRDERRAIEQEITGMEHEIPALGTQLQTLRSGALPEKILLLAREATLRSAVVNSSNAIAGWTAERSQAQWTLPDLPQGGYEVVMTYTCATKGGAPVKFQESFYSLLATLPSTPEKPQERLLGTLRLRNGKSSLRLETPELPPGTDLRIYSVALIPANR